VPLRTEGIHVIFSQTPLMTLFFEWAFWNKVGKTLPGSHRFSRFLWQRGDVDERAHEADANSVPYFSRTGRPCFRLYFQ